MNIIELYAYGQRLIMDEIDSNALAILHETLRISESRVYEHVTTTFRWLMATLFTANGGAIVALINRGTEVHGTRGALAAFAVGLILALLMAISSTFVGFRTAVELLRMRMHVEHALMTGERPSVTLEEFTLRQRPTWKTLLPSCFGVGSLLSFICGAGLVAAASVR